MCKKDYICNPATCSCKNSKYLASIIDDSVISCDEIKEETKTIPTNFDEKKQPVQQKNLYFTFPFIDYDSITDSCYNLLLPDKISSKTKTFNNNKK